MSSLTWPAGVLVVALCSLLAFAPPIAYVTSATTLRRARSRGLRTCPWLHSTPCRCPRLQSRAHSTKRCRATHARVRPGHGNSRQSHNSGARTHPGLESSQLGPDASPSVPPPSNVHSSGINPNLSKQPLCDSPSGVHVSPMFVIFHPSFSTSPLP